jgi:hypothetical protein
MKMIKYNRIVLLVIGIISLINGSEINAQKEESFKTITPNVTEAILASPTSQATIQTKEMTIITQSPPSTLDPKATQDSTKPITIIENSTTTEKKPTTTTVQQTTEKTIPTSNTQSDPPTQTTLSNEDDIESIVTSISDYGFEYYDVDEEKGEKKWNYYGKNLTTSDKFGLFIGLSFGIIFVVLTILTTVGLCLKIWRRRSYNRLEQLNLNSYTQLNGSGESLN